MEMKEEYIIAFKGPNALTGKNIMEKSMGWLTLEGLKLKQTLENAFKVAELVGVLNSADKQRIINKEINWVEDYCRIYKDGNGWKLTEFLETETGYIIRAVVCEGAFVEFKKKNK